MRAIISCILFQIVALGEQSNCFSQTALDVAVADLVADHCGQFAFSLVSKSFCLSRFAIEDLIPVAYVWLDCEREKVGKSFKCGAPRALLSEDDVMRCICGMSVGQYVELVRYVMLVLDVCGRIFSDNAFHEMRQLSQDLDEQASVAAHQHEEAIQFSEQLVQLSTELIEFLRSFVEKTGELTSGSWALARDAARVERELSDTVSATSRVSTQCKLTAEYARDGLEDTVAAIESVRSEVESAMTHLKSLGNDATSAKFCIECIIYFLSGLACVSLSMACCLRTIPPSTPALIMFALTAFNVSLAKARDDGDCAISSTLGLLSCWYGVWVLVSLNTIAVRYTLKAFVPEQDVYSGNAQALGDWTQSCSSNVDRVEHSKSADLDSSTDETSSQAYDNGSSSSDTTSEWSLDGVH